MGFSPCSYLEHILFLGGADLPAASQEWNERVDIEPLPPTSARALYQGTTLVVPHTSPQRWALAPVPISSTFCSSRGSRGICSSADPSWICFSPSGATLKQVAPMVFVLDNYDSFTYNLV